MLASGTGAAISADQKQDEQGQRLRLKVAAIFFALVILAMALAPSVLGNTSLAFYLMFWITMASALNIVVGFTGYLPFGYVVFYGIGAYAAGICYRVLGLPIPLALMASGLAGITLALLLTPTLRLKGVYFGIVSLALATIARLVISNLPSGITGGSMGLILASSNNPTHSYYTMLLVMTATLVSVLWLSQSAIGKALKAIKDDDGAAAVIGIDVPRTRLVAWLMAALFPALAGGVEAWHTNIIDPEYSFHVLMTAKSIVYAMAGGFGTIIGPVIGTIVLVAVDHVIWQRLPLLNLLLLGMVIIALMMFLPRGIVGTLTQRFPRLRRFIA